MLGSSRNFRLGLTSLLLTAFGTAMLTGTTSPLSAAQTSPSYSPTGVCVNGTPELEFSVLGLPSGQVNTVGFGVFSSPMAEGNGELHVDGSSVNALWNLSGAGTGNVCPVCVEPIRRGWRPIRRYLYQLGESVAVVAAAPNDGCPQSSSRIPV